jgi:CubicO group peptidase (beta-lactamase class C family)
MQAYAIPGAAIAVVDKGKVIFKKAYGVANLETDTPVKTNSVFELASLTKPFTAAAVMLLVEEGKVQLDSPVSAYVENTPEGWRGITVRHLLTHTAGFPGEAPVQWEGSALMNVTARQQFDFIARAPLLFPPGERALYSDPGYVLLGRVIEKASGMPYRDFVQRRIFEPLQMTDSSVLDQWRIIKNRVSPYAIRNGRLLRGRRDWQIETPSNFGLFSTVEDLVKFDAAIAGSTLLKRSSLEQMWTPAKLNNGQDVLPMSAFGDPYGLGWLLGELRGHRTVEHGGFSGTHMLRLPEDGLTVIVLTNLDLASGNRPDVIARGIAGLIKPEYQPPHLASPQTDPAPQTTQDIRALLTDVAEGRSPRVMTAACLSFFNNLPPQLREDIARRLKTLNSLTYVTSDNVEGRGLKRMGEPVARISYFRGELGQRVFHFTFWITKEGKVAHMRFAHE